MMYQDMKYAQYVVNVYTYRKYPNDVMHLQNKKTNDKSGKMSNLPHEYPYEKVHRIKENKKKMQNYHHLRRC